MWYHLATASCRQSDFLFGFPAFCCTIARWIEQVTIQDYGVNNRVPPLPVNVHSTRSINAFLVYQHQAPVCQVFMVATLSLVHTFVKFYKVNAQASFDGSFG